MDPPVCCICREQPLAKPRTCGACGVLTCQPCLRAYVQKTCVTCVKCPTYACTEEVSERELSDLLSKTFACDELRRMRREGLKLQDEKHMQVTEVVYLPVARRFLDTAAHIARAREARIALAEETRDVCAQLFAIFTEALGVTGLDVWDFSLADFVATQFRTVLSYTGSWSFQYDELKSLSPALVGAVYERWPELQAEATIGPGVFESISLLSRRQSPSDLLGWGSHAMRFAGFLNALLQLWAQGIIRSRTNYRQLHEWLELRHGHLSALGMYDVALRLWKLCHQFPQAEQRLSYMVDLSRELLGAMRKPVALVSSFDPSKLAPLDHAYADPYYSGVNWHATKTHRLFVEGNGMSQADMEARRWACSLPGCRGSFTEGRPACNTCDAMHCVRCHEHAAEGHACVAESVASVNVIASNTRPCPRCSSAIHKVGGCAP